MFFTVKDTGSVAYSVMGDATLGNSVFENPNEEESVEAITIQDGETIQELSISSDESDMWVTKTPTMAPNIIANIETVHMERVNTNTEPTEDKDLLIAQLMAQLNALRSNPVITDEGGKGGSSTDMDGYEPTDNNIPNDNTTNDSRSQTMRRDIAGSGGKN